MMRPRRHRLLQPLNLFPQHPDFVGQRREFVDVIQRSRTDQHAGHQTAQGAKNSGNRKTQDDTSSHLAEQLPVRQHAIK